MRKNFSCNTTKFYRYCQTTIKIAWKRCNCKVENYYGILLKTIVSLQAIIPFILCNCQLVKVTPEIYKTSEAFTRDFNNDSIKNISNSPLKKYLIVYYKDGSSENIKKRCMGS